MSARPKPRMGTCLLSGWGGHIKKAAVKFASLDWRGVEEVQRPSAFALRWAVRQKWSGGGGRGPKTRGQVEQGAAAAF